MTDKIQAKRILAFGIALLSILLVLVPTSWTDMWPYESWSLAVFRILANLAALVASVISLVLIWRRQQPKGYVTELALFLSFGALAYGVATLSPIIGWPIFEKSRILSVTALTGLAFSTEILFVSKFQRDFIGEVQPTGKRKYTMGQDYFEWLFVGNRFLFASTAIILSGLLCQIFLDPNDLHIFIIGTYGIFCTQYTGGTMMSLYKSAEDSAKGKLLWVAYGFYGLPTIPIYLFLVKFCLNIVGIKFLSYTPISLALAALVLVITIGISLFATDLFNVQLVIRKTITYGALSLILVFLFAVLEEAFVKFLGNYFESLVKYDSLLMAGILAVTGSLLRKGIDKFVGKYLKF